MYADAVVEVDAVSLNRKMRARGLKNWGERKRVGKKVDVLRLERVKRSRWVFAEGELVTGFCLEFPLIHC